MTGPIKAEAAEITAFARSSPESAAQWRSLLLIWLLIDALKLGILSGSVVAAEAGIALLRAVVAPS